MPVSGEEVGGEHRGGVPGHGGVENGGSEGLEKAVRPSLIKSRYLQHDAGTDG